MQELCREARLRYKSHRLESVPFSLMGNAAIWFIELPYNSIYTLD